MTAVALVTGGGTGSARPLPALARGRRVCGRRDRPAARADRGGGRGNRWPRDRRRHGRAADTERAVAETVDRFGGLDALVLNAGIGGEGSLLDLDPETFDDVFRVNVTGAFLMARAAIPHLLERRGASSRSLPSPACGRRRRRSPTAPRRPRSRC